jgi:hypothetical protein
VKKPGYTCGLNTKLRSKLLLALSILLTAVGLILNSGLVHLEKAVGLYALLPVGVTFFGLFLISKFLENETPVHEDDHRRAAAGERERVICRDPNAVKAAPPGS